MQRARNRYLMFWDARQRVAEHWAPSSFGFKCSQRFIKARSLVPKDFFLLLLAKLSLARKYKCTTFMGRPAIWSRSIDGEWAPYSKKVANWWILISICLKWNWLHETTKRQHKINKCIDSMSTCAGVYPLWYVCVGVWLVGLSFFMHHSTELWP